MPAQAGRVAVRRGEASSKAASDETRLPRQELEGTGRDLLTQALARENMQRAWKRVKANKGAAGVDGLDIARTGQHLKHAWPTIKQQLMEGTYRPLPVRRVGIPKPDGSERELGIPSVTDRLIQQALLQVLQALIDPTFSEHSHGFRPGRRARDAVLAAQQYVQEGYRTVADVDLSKFFDRVNHDILIDRLRKRVNDAGVTPRVLGKLDEWMRHRLRAIHLKHWRRGATIYRELLKTGAKPKLARLVARNSRRWWHNSRLALNSVLTIAYFDRLGMPRLT